MLRVNSNTVLSDVVVVVTVVTSTRQQLHYFRIEVVSGGWHGDVSIVCMAVVVVFGVVEGVERGVVVIVIVVVDDVVVVGGGFESRRSGWEVVVL